MAFKMKEAPVFKHTVSTIVDDRTGKTEQRLHSFDTGGHRHVEGMTIPTKPKKKKKK